MGIVMVKKRLVSGESCNKCAQAEEQLRRRGLWERIDKVVWALEDEPESLGWELARRHAVEAAPFYLVGDADSVSVYTSTLTLIREVLTAENTSENTAEKTFEIKTPPPTGSAAELAARFETEEPQEIIRWALATHGTETALAFSGAEDVVLIHMAASLGLPFTAITIDTGRLHPETYEFVDWVRERYGIELIVTSPNQAEIETLVRAKGLFSFYRDGHAECCEIRKVKPLRRALVGRPAWITGQRRDQGADTRGDLPVVQVDAHLGSGTGIEGSTELLKINPLAGWSAEKVWSFIRANELPHNPLHGRGFASIGCAPCTRPILPGQGPRDGRWWWEGSEGKECGLHAQNLRSPSDSDTSPDTSPDTADSD